MRKAFSYTLSVILILVCHVPMAEAQDDVMMQGFYWDVPVDDVNENGSWWDTLAVKAPELGAAGITGIWTPAPSKGNFGIYDMGYGIFDHYDLGNYDQKGSVETRFGSRSELINMVNTMHNNGIEVYADIILNHIYTGASEEETNPAVKNYVFDEAVRDPDGNGISSQYSPYPTNEIVWRIPSAGTGDYYIKIKGYHLDWGASYTERGYDLTINWDASPDQPNDPNNANWESEPNDGNGQYNVFPGSGEHIWAHINEQGDIDEYKITLSASHDIILRLEARREGTDCSGGWTFAYASQTNGYYPFEIWHNGQNLAASTLEARTNTGISYVSHTGSGEQNWTWDYGDFHPVDDNDYLGYPGNDEIIPNTKFFGNDLNTFDTAVENRMITWGQWLTNTVGYDGYRLDFVRGFQIEYGATWVNNMPMKSGGAQRFVVGEYWGSKPAIKDWVTGMESNGADADAFDFPLKFTLTDMTNWNGSNFDMNWLNHAGMIRDDGGNSLSGTQVVTFVDNHDSGKEHDKWVTRDWDMAYAYILFAEGRPTIFYPHYYAVTQTSQAECEEHTVTAPAGLRNKLDELMFTRRTYLNGGMIVLSEIGNPWPSEDTYDVYAARRQGNGSKSGAILVLNNHETDQKGLWVDNAPASGYDNWANKVLVNATNGGQDEAQVYSDGRVYVWAPARGYAVWVVKEEYEAFSKLAVGEQDMQEETSSSEVPREFQVFQNYPNPFNPATSIAFELPEAGHIIVEIFNVRGEYVTTLVDGVLPAGNHKRIWNAAERASGVYYYRVSWQGRSSIHKMLLLK